MKNTLKKILPILCTILVFSMGFLGAKAALKNTVSTKNTNTLSAKVCPTDTHMDENWQCVSDKVQTGYYLTVKYDDTNENILDKTFINVDCGDNTDTCTLNYMLYTDEGGTEFNEALKNSSIAGNVVTKLVVEDSKGNIMSTNELDKKFIAEEGMVDSFRAYGAGDYPEAPLLKNNPSYVVRVYSDSASNYALTKINFYLDNSKLITKTFINIEADGFNNASMNTSISNYPYDLYDIQIDKIYVANNGVETLASIGWNSENYFQTFNINTWGDETVNTLSYIYFTVNSGQEVATIENPITYNVFLKAVNKYKTTATWNLQGQTFTSESNSADSDIYLDAAPVIGLKDNEGNVVNKNSKYTYDFTVIKHSSITGDTDVSDSISVNVNQVWGELEDGNWGKTDNLSLSINADASNADETLSYSITLNSITKLQTSNVVMTINGDEYTETFYGKFYDGMSDYVNVSSENEFFSSKDFSDYSWRVNWYKVKDGVKTLLNDGKQYTWQEDGSTYQGSVYAYISYQTWGYLNASITWNSQYQDKLNLEYGDNVYYLADVTYSLKQGILQSGIGGFEGQTWTYLLGIQDDWHNSDNTTIKTITFGDSSILPSSIDASNYVELSQNDYSIKGYVNDSEVYVISDRKITFYNDSMSSMFDRLKALETIDGLEWLDTSNVTNMSSMFSGCSSLTSLDLSNFDTSKVTDMSYMFYNCSSLTSLNLSNFNTSNVTSMSSMFSGCSSLTSLDLSNFNTSNVTSMSSMFYRCSSLTSLNLSNFNTSNVTDMRYMFYNCSKLTSLDVSNFDTSKVTNMDGMFEGCSKLTSLDVSNFNTSNVTDMSSMFNNCSSLTSLDVSNFNTSNVTDMRYMFYNCSSLTSLDVSNFDTSNVTDMRYMFSGCSKLTSLDVSNFDTSKVTNMDGMFEGCSKLTSLDVSNFNTSNVTDMSSMFNNCSSLTSLDVSNFNTSKVKTFAWMFSDCRSLITITGISNFDVTNALGTTNSWTYDENGNAWNDYGLKYMFQNCYHLEVLDLSGWDIRNTVTISNIFSVCYSLKVVFIGENWQTTSVQNGDMVFSSGMYPNFTSNLSSLDYTYAKDYSEGGFLIKSSPVYRMIGEIKENYRITGISSMVKIDGEIQEIVIDHDKDGLSIGETYTLQSDYLKNKNGVVTITYKNFGGYSNNSPIWNEYTATAELDSATGTISFTAANYLETNTAWLYINLDTTATQSEAKQVEFFEEDDEITDEIINEIPADVDKDAEQSVQEEIPNETDETINDATSDAETSNEENSNGETFETITPEVPNSNISDEEMSDTDNTNEASDMEVDNSSSSETTQDIEMPNEETLSDEIVIEEIPIETKETLSEETNSEVIE